MQSRALHAFALAAVLLVAGCTGLGGTGTPTQDGSPTPTVTPAPEPTPTPSPTATPAPVDSLPSPAACLADAAPRPGTVDGVAPSPYPEPPAEVTRDAVVNWTRAFERAYFRNALLAEEPGDDDHDLSEVSAYAEVRGVNHTADGYVVRFSDFGATTYKSGMHGDRWTDVGYVVSDARVVRVPLDDDGPVRASEGTVVVGCR